MQMHNQYLPIASVNLYTYLYVVTYMFMHVHSFIIINLFRIAWLT